MKNHTKIFMDSEGIRVIADGKEFGITADGTCYIKPMQSSFEAKD